MVGLLRGCSSLTRDGHMNRFFCLLGIFLVLADSGLAESLPGTTSEPLYPDRVKMS